MEHFYNLLRKKEKEFLDNLFNKEITVNEKIDGASFNAERTSDGWVFFKRNAKNKITVLDRTLMKFYEDVIEFFENKPDNVLNKIPVGYRFEMEFVKNKKPPGGRSIILFF